MPVTQIGTLPLDFKSRGRNRQPHHNLNNGLGPAQKLRNEGCGHPGAGRAMLGRALPASAEIVTNIIGAD